MEELPPDPEPEVKEGEEGKEGTEQKVRICEDEAQRGALRTL